MNFGQWYMCEGYSIMFELLKWLAVLTAGGIPGFLGWWIYCRAANRDSSPQPTRRALGIVAVSLGLVVVMALTILGCCIALVGFSPSISAVIDNLDHLSMTMVLGWHNMAGICAMCVSSRKGVKL